MVAVDSCLWFIHGSSLTGALRVVTDWWGPMGEAVLAKEGLPYEQWDLALLTKICKSINPTVRHH